MVPEVKSLVAASRRRGREITVAASQRGYRRFAPFYDLFFGLSLRHGRLLAIEALDARPGERILEVGVGSGLSLPLHRRDVSVIGIDISAEMLNRARRRVQHRDLKQITALLEMDVADLSFVDASFDKTVIMYALSGFPDPLCAMAEIRRVCKPGASIVIANHFRSEGPLARFFDHVLAPVYRLLRYRADMQIERFVEAADLEILSRKPANLFGYSTVLVCRARVQVPTAGTRAAADCVDDDEGSYLEAI